MELIDGAIPAITPQGIKDMLDQKFTGKPMTMKTEREFQDYKARWVNTIISNGQIQNALYEYIGMFKFTK